MRQFRVEQLFIFPKLPYMKFHWHSILPFGIILAGGMAVGSLHNAISRDVIPVPIGSIFILLSFFNIIVGLILSRYYEGLPSVGYWGAFGLAAYVAFGGIFNIVTTPELDSLLFHEYLLPIVGILQVIKLLVEKFSKTSVKA
ncbi:hypothetical protein MNBD_CHLOROFLEXI01-124 [hydrothermal vent metagenome]|uniref:Uncharacterized protein n=1 Tax=hydrothermal vent metagenome TaxID=652676 RepID=A0A3B0V5H1_9ZZZZ